MVVEALLHHASDLRLRGDLAALQALQAEQGDGRHRKRLKGEGGGVVERKNKGQRSEEAALVVARTAGAATPLTMGTTLTERGVKPSGQPMLVRLG